MTFCSFRNAVYVDTPAGKLSLRKASAKYGLTIYVIKKRAAQGLTGEALVAPKAKRKHTSKPRVRYWSAYGYLTLSEVSQRINIPANQLQKRILGVGWAPTEAFNTPIGGVPWEAFIIPNDEYQRRMREHMASAEFLKAGK